MQASEPAEVYVKYADDLVRFASAVAGPTDAEDVVAAVMTRVLLGGDRWRSVDNLHGFLVRAVLNEARSRYRSQRRRRVRERVDRSDRPHAAARVADPASEVRPIVMDAMGRLTVRQRAVVYLTYWLEYRADEVAAELAISVRTVQRELTTARHRLEVLLS